MMHGVSALSTLHNTDAAISNVVQKVAESVRGESADLAVVFTTSHHAGALDRVSQTLREQSLARHVLGCTGESIIGEGHEVEGSPALSVWAIQLPGAKLYPRRLTTEGYGVLGMEERVAPSDRHGERYLIMVGDPYSFAIEPFLRSLESLAPGMRVVGGMASAGHAPGRNRLVLDDELYEDGAVGIELGGELTLRTVVSQGCRPIGRTFLVTKVERNIIRELGRRPAMQVLHELFDELPPDDQDRMREGLHIGRVINEYQETFQRGDFLVRNVLGTDEAGGIAVNETLKVGQTVQFQVRDAESADLDLRSFLQEERTRRPSELVRGALLFSCNGRGTRLFEEPNHDVGLIREVLGPVPVGGFFAMGELGPVGGQNFVHGFTASILLFLEAHSPGEFAKIVL
jgi:small ligand-binding sensory domain FIST